MSRRPWAAMLVLVALTGCGRHAAPADSTVPATNASTSTGTPSPTAEPTSTPAAAPAGPRTEKWVELRVGDCMSEVPAVDLGAVTVDVVDCATAHRGEVYLLAPIAVNAAVTDVANQACTAGVTPYTGQPAGAFSVTYLIDSRQDRTSDNPLPSTVICILQGADGHALTGSARR